MRHDHVQRNPLTHKTASLSAKQMPLNEGPSQPCRSSLMSAASILRDTESADETGVSPEKCHVTLEGSAARRLKAVER